MNKRISVINIKEGAKNINIDERRRIIIIVHLSSNRGAGDPTLKTPPFEKLPAPKKKMLKKEQVKILGGEMEGGHYPITIKTVATSIAEKDIGFNIPQSPRRIMCQMMCCC